MGIFGFCYINFFSEVTEVLQANIMMFVNEIAEIVHSRIDEYMGAANKNIGDAFLLVWKFDKSSYTISGDDITLIKSKKVEVLCDLSIVSFI